jgi:hypothetical protein
VQRLRERFGIERLAIVGDRGMISHKAIDSLRALDGVCCLANYFTADLADYFVTLGERFLA